ncbi:hypothetical protein D9Q98_010163 [Chlorella vulgaris]|uniref:Golgi SNAP receptor complex member 1 n=1 Tax=Chlorella vulgaris TaxID=3077 RepID=A0A9D4TMT2_CHLVU|nr:hypothetical protein D9Q98_010163 [Chlorella vulgaris]
MNASRLPDAVPPAGRHVAFAYQTPVTPTKMSIATQSSQKAWDDLRREARKLEGELDMKVAAYGKLCSNYEYGYSKGESGMATDQLLQAKCAEIEQLISRLSDANDGMRSALSGGADSRSHTLARHRDILHDFQQEFRRLQSIVGAARDRLDLLGGAGGGQHAPLHQTAGNAGLLLRERGMLASTNAALDEVMGTAQAVSGGLGQQRSMFEGISGKMSSLGSKFPVVNTLMNAIRRRKNRDNFILAAVVAACTLFILVYWWNK